MKNEILKYANGLNANKVTIDFLKNLDYRNKNQGEVEHIIDFLIHKDFVSLDWASYDLLLLKSKKWIKQLSQNVAAIDEEYNVDIEIALDFENGFRFVKVLSKKSYKREGALMSHCVASYYGRDVEIFSLRDEFNKPHCTIEKDIQIKGRGNGSISPKYIDYVVRFLEFTGMQVREGEMRNLGYIIPPFYQYCVNDLYRDKYLRDNENIVYQENVVIFEGFDGFKANRKNDKINCVGGYVDLEGATIPEGFVMPESVGGYVDK